VEESGLVQDIISRVHTYTHTLHTCTYTHTHIARTDILHICTHTHTYAARIHTHCTHTHSRKHIMNDACVRAQFVCMYVCVCVSDSNCKTLLCSFKMNTRTLWLSIWIALITICLWNPLFLPKTVIGMFMYVCIVCYVCVYECMYVCICMCVCMCVWAEQWFCVIL